jgi:hypothetical protein
MKTRSANLLVLAVLALPCTVANAQTPGHQERIEASFLLALGRGPSADEARACAGPDTSSVPALVALHRQRLQSDPALRRSVAIKACRDALGREPSEPEIDTWSTAGRTYAELMGEQVQRLAEHPDDYREVIDRAYRLVVHRAAHSIEFDYWNGRGTLPFMLLVGCIEDWARRNAPGLMSTTGMPSVSVNSAHLTTVRLPPAIAREARAAAGLAADKNPAWRATLGRHVIAAGAGELASVGGIHFVAAGRADFTPARLSAD